jgi:hypothetical protein
MSTNGNTIVKKLTTEEKQELVKLENIIRTNRKSFEELVKALATIHARKLYRDKYNSFQEYCSEKWQFTRDYGYKLVQAYNTEQKLLEAGVAQSQIPKTENKRRTVAKLANDTAKAEGRDVEPNDFKEALETVEEDSEKKDKKSRTRKGKVSNEGQGNKNKIHVVTLEGYEKELRNLEGIYAELGFSVLQVAVDAYSRELGKKKLAKK